MKITMAAYAILASALISGVTFGQNVPLALNQTIVMPVESAIWDVMPHPDGYFVWAQATAPDSDQTRIYWGRSDLGNVDSLDLDVGEPQNLVCFWRDNYEPYLVLASRHVYEPYDATLLGHHITGRLDDTGFRVYRLTDGRPDSLFYHWPARLDYLTWDTWDLLVNFRMGVAMPTPPPPAVSTTLALGISWDHPFTYNDYPNPYSAGYPHLQSVHS